MNSRKISLIIGSILLILILGVLASNYIGYILFTPTDGDAEEGLSAEEVNYSVLAQELEVPWEVSVLDEERFLVTERTGDVVYFEENEQTTLRSFDDVYGGFMGEGGLLGMALDPNFEENNFVYFYLTEDDGENVENLVVRMVFDSEDPSLTEEEILIDSIPSDRIHNGGRIEFGPDEKLYITTGDAAEPELAQDIDSLAGKILRINRDGSIPEDNPLDDEIYSYGHRNPQGITWDSENRMWSTEHGDIGNDELNLIEAGSNYGWPVIEGDESYPEMEEPVIHSGSESTWAPSGAVYYNGSIFFAGLRGESLYEARLNGTEVVNLVRHFESDFGRLRGVTLDYENNLYLTTSNTDGRGLERENNDRIIRIDSEIFVENH